MSNYNSILQSNNTALSSNNLDLQSLIDQASALPDAGGVDLPTLRNEGSASDLLSGMQLIDQDGNVVTGTMPRRESSSLTASGETVTVPAGYYASQATKSVSTATQATPIISVDSTGKITASVTQTAGYVVAGTKSATKQLAFQAAKTITPSTASQIAVSSGYYTGGSITVAAVPTQSKTVTPTSSAQNITPDSGKFLSKVTVNAIPSSYIQPTGTKTITANGTHDVKSYASVSVSVASSGGGDTSIEDGLVTRTVANYTNDRITTIGNYAFYLYSRLTTVSFPMATSIGDYAFNTCTSLTTTSFPVVRTIGAGAFSYCTRLTTVSFPVATSIGAGAFSGCSNLTTVSFPVATTIGNYAFYNCSSLTTASFPVATTIGNNAFGNCSSLTTASFPVATTIGNYAFGNCTRLTTVSFPVAMTISGGAFSYCTSLTTASFPAATTIGNNAFDNCTRLTTVSFPVATNIGFRAFNNCTSLTTASFPVATSIGDYAFGSCHRLSQLYLLGSSVCTLSHSNAFASTPIGGYSTLAGTYGSIYVPASLLSSYQRATNWTYFSSRFSAMGGTEPEGGTATIITFTVYGSEYQAEEGMTWGEWTESQYNTDTFFDNGTYIIGTMGPIYNGDNQVQTTDVILQNGSYGYFSPGGSEP